MAYVIRESLTYFLNVTENRRNLILKFISFSRRITELFNKLLYFFVFLFFCILLDPILSESILLRTATPTILICVTYLLIVLKIGPEFMKNRKEFDLKRVIFAYNLFQITYNSFIVYVVSILKM